MLTRKSFLESKEFFKALLDVQPLRKAAENFRVLVFPLVLIFEAKCV